LGIVPSTSGGVSLRLRAHSSRRSETDEFRDSVPPDLVALEEVDVVGVVDDATTDAGLT
jgi:hypothetical protein